MHLKQAKYILELLDKVNMIGAKPYATSYTSGKRVTKFDEDPLSYLTHFKYMIGDLQYCILLRHDITYFVNQLC